MAKNVNIIGEKFGMLTVVGRTERRVNHYTVWECRCDCGGEIQVDTKKLKRGTIWNCGCIPKNNARNGTEAENLTGQRFGKLVAVQRLENRNGRTVWLCRCDCGQTKAVQSNNLKSGKVKSCGCLSRAMDITGQRFGQLTALYPTTERDQKHSVLWHCRCDCGNEVDISYGNLVYGNYKSCGCLRAENQKRINSRLHHVDGTCVEWLEKRKHRSDNSTGYQGVSMAKNGKYRVSIGFQGKRYYLGTYEKLQDAVEVRRSAEQKLHDGFVKDYRRWEEKAKDDREWADSHPFSFHATYLNGEFQVHSSMDIEHNPQ